MTAIAYLDPYPVPDTRTASLQILQNADAFARCGAQLDLITPAGPMTAGELLGRPLHPGAAMHPLKNIRRRWFFPFNSQRGFFLQALHWLRSHPVDALYVRNLKLADFLLKRRPDLPLFFEPHELFARSFAESHDLSRRRNRRKHRILQHREKRVYQQAAALFALTSLLADDIRDTAGTGRPVYIAPDGVDRIAADQARPAAAQPFHDPVRILYLGSLHPWKGLPTLLRALPNVSGAGLTVAGGSAREIDALRRAAADLGISDRVDFPGFIEPRRRFGIIADADLCILPLTNTAIGSRCTSPLKLFEYMAMGKPIVVSDLPAIREAVDETCVRFAQSEDPDSFAQALRDLIEHPDRAAALAATARQRAQVFTWERRAQHILARIQDHLDTCDSLI